MCLLGPGRAPTMLVRMYCSIAILENKLAIPQKVMVTTIPLLSKYRSEIKMYVNTKINK